MDTTNQTPIETPAPPPGQPKPLPHRPRLLIIGIVGLVLLVLGIGGGYLIAGSQEEVVPSTPSVTHVPPTALPSPTANPTASWKKYSNPSLGVAFMHPPELVITDYIEENGFVILASEEVVIPDGTDAPPLGIMTIGLNRCTNTQTKQTFPCEKTIADLTEKRKVAMEKEGFSSTPVTFDGVSGAQISGNWLKDGPGNNALVKETVFPVKNYLLLITLQDMSKETLYNQIISTLIFL